MVEDGVVVDVTRMWEAHAAEGCLDGLLAWLDQALAGTSAEIYRGVGDSGDVVVVLLHPQGSEPSVGGKPSTAAAAAASVLDGVPPSLLARSARGWDFMRVSSRGRNTNNQEGA